MVKIKLDISKIVSCNVVAKVNIFLARNCNDQKADFMEQIL